MTEQTGQPTAADTSREWTAWFPKVEYATTFAERLREPGWWATDVVQKGRTVTFTERPPADVIEQDGWGLIEVEMRQTVGYYGSSQNRRAKLNGRPCPMSY